MVNSMVERATSDMLIGPDWAMNLEICDICNNDPAQAKDVVKGIKRRIRSRNSKVQLLALTLLETIVKNCGDFVHMHVAERDVLTEMVKIVKKKPDFHVKEKILILIDTWQEAFGGARARYPQYYAAYHELLRMGAVFPQRTERSAPVFTPPQTQPLTSYPHNLRNPENGREVAESSAEAEFPTLSLTEIQNARGIMDVLADMLTAISPENKEELRQDVILDLVEQCRTYKQRVVHLVNSTSDESLLCQGLALNDDLQRVLAKHEALLSGTSVPLKTSKPETSQALVPVDSLLIDTGDTKQPGSTSSGGVDSQLLSLAPITTNGASATPAKVNPKFDLLSGDDLAIVPVGEPQPSTPVPQHNALALVDMFSENNTYSSPEIPQSQSQEPSFYPNGSVPNTGPPQYEPQSPYSQAANPAWNGQQSPSPLYGDQASSGLPPPPWEAQAADDNQSGATLYSQPQATPTYMQQPIAGSHLSPMSNQNQSLHPQQFQSQPPMGMMLPLQQSQPGQMLPQQQSQPGQMAYMYPQQMYTNQMGQPYGYGGAGGGGGYGGAGGGYGGAGGGYGGAGGGYGGAGGGYGYGYGYGQPQNAQILDQRMTGLSVNSTVYKGPSMANASYVHVPSGKPSKQEDKFFGDLVDFSKVKPNKTTPGRAESM